jgi:hypothetical protein
VRGERCLVTLAAGQHVAVAATVQPKPNPRPSRNLGREEFGELDLLLQSPRRGSRVAPNCLYCYDCPAQTPRNAEKRRERRLARRRVRHSISDGGSFRSFERRAKSGNAER